MTADDSGVRTSEVMQQMVSTSDYSLKWWDKIHGYKVEEIFHEYQGLMERLSEMIQKDGDLQVVEFKVGNRTATLMWHERVELP